MTDDREARILSGAALFETMGDFRVTGFDAEKREATARFTVRREFCHSGATIAQGGFVTAWLDAVMAQAIIRDRPERVSVASLEIKVTFLERVGPGEGRCVGRIIRRGKRIAFIEGPEKVSIELLERWKV